MLRKRVKTSGASTWLEAGTMAHAGIPTADALMALFWHTAYFMGGPLGDLMICILHPV